MFLPECYGTIDNPGNVTFFFFQYLSNFASEGEESRARLKDSGDGEARIDEGNQRVELVCQRDVCEATTDQTTAYIISGPN